jgi:hypothetical protein
MVAYFTGAVEGAGDDNPGGIPRLKLDAERDDDSGFRVFGMVPPHLEQPLESFQGTSENDWGMQIEWPEWIQKAHNTKSGRIFICGSGPSLYDQYELLKRLKDEDTWTVNRIAKWKELPFTPTYHSIAEPGPIAAWGRIVFDAYNFPTAGTRIAINWWPVTAKGWLWCPKAPDDVQTRWHGSQGMSERLAPIPTAWASPLTSAQLALWFGYTEIVILGCDTTQLGQAWDKEKGRTAEPRNIRSILECADQLNRDIRRGGRTLIDCTPGGRLNVEGSLEYRELADVL